MLAALIQAGADPLTNSVDWLAGNKPMASIPPSFHGERGTYGFALFSLLFTCAMVATALYGSIHNALQQRKFSGWRDPININRYIIWQLLLGILIGAFPDAVVMLTWGEVSYTSSMRIAEVDRFMDGMVMFPIVSALILWYRAKPVINYQLIIQPLPIDLWPRWRQMLPQIRIAAICAFISLGVALGK